METINGNILECNEQVIVHQTNCLGVMGSGIALQIKEKYPDVFKGYYYYCNTNQATDILGTTLICEASDGKYIANVFGQLNYGKGLQTDYEALEKGLQEVMDFAKERGLTVAIPYRIGCGRGHGNWQTVSKIIKKVSKQVPVTLYKYDI